MQGLDKASPSVDLPDSRTLAGRVRLNGRVELAVHPVDSSRWGDLTELFGPSGATRGCWCMARRLSSRERENAGNAENRAAMESLVRDGQPVGVLGYVDESPVAWCAVAPRSAYQAIIRSRTLPIDERDDATIWAINCLFVKAGHRKQSLTTPMIEAAVEYARRSGARIVEAYPVETPPGDLSFGLVGMFLDAGFEVYERDRTTSKRNVVVRRMLPRRSPGRTTRLLCRRQTEFLHRRRNHDHDDHSGGK
jgi:GNAT superfamily N-acetyltransferase